MLSAMRNRFAVLAMAMLLLAPSATHGQDGCYFGVCPGDPGTEFPTTPTVTLPPTIALPAPQPAPAPEPTTGKTKEGKTKAPVPPPMQSAVELLCLGAFKNGGEFTWEPPMTISNALAVCEAALREKPESLDLQFYYAVARDVWAQWGGGSPADDYYAVTAYRELAEQGYTMAEYALGTMYDEDAGVTEAEGIAIQARAVAGEFGLAAACQSYLALVAQDDLEAAGLTFEAASFERKARDSAMCSSRILNIVSYAGPGEFATALPMEHYARVGATNGTGWGMYYLGAFYAVGSSGSYSPAFTGRVTLTRNLERGGMWLLLHYWWSMQRTDLVRTHDEWFGQYYNGDTALALQTALKSLGYYSGTIDGNIGPQSKAALSAFLAADIADTLFQRIRTEEPTHPLLPRMGDVRLGDAALTMGS